MAGEGEKICSKGNGLVLSDESGKKQTAALAKEFIKAVSLHRTWDRLYKDDVPV